MAEPRNKPSQASFGFDDPELKTPAHDALMVWIDEYICEILVEVLELGEEPEIVKKEWERIIKNKRGFTVGVADLYVRIRVSKPFKLPKSVIVIKEESVIFVEAKPKIPSLGELIRQIHFSETGDLAPFVTRAEVGDPIWPKWLVVAPDDRFAKTLREQGILFHKSPKL
jgi:hypothetical protein